MSATLQLPRRHSMVVWDTETIQTKQALREVLGLPEDTSAELLADVALANLRRKELEYLAKKTKLQRKFPRVSEKNRLAMELEKLDRKFKFGLPFGSWLNHRVRCLSAAWFDVKRGDTVNDKWRIDELTFNRLESYGEPDAKEKKIVRLFLEDVEDLEPQMVTHNGTGYDLPVVFNNVVVARVRDKTKNTMPPLRHFLRCAEGVRRGAPEHQRWHVDSMQAFAFEGAIRFPSLNVLAQTLGWPGKMGKEGSGVLHMFLLGQLDEIFAYCECDVLNTALNHLTWLVVQEILPAPVFNQTMAQVMEYLKNEGEKRPHLAEFRRLTLLNNPHGVFLPEHP